MRLQSDNESVCNFTEVDLNSSIVEAVEAVKILSDDEGVFDLDAEDDSTCTASAPQSPSFSRTISRPVKGRFTRIVEEQESLRVREQFLQMTQTKLNSACRSDGLRNKVLIESALKKCLTQTSIEKRNKLQVNLDHEQCSPHRADNDLHRPPPSNQNQSASHATSKSAPSSPRKRRAIKPESQTLELDWNSAIKKLKALNYDDMDTTEEQGHQTVEIQIPLNSENVFYCIKAQH
ncbi:hypothetical protein HDE_05366 [Halotydeus destructor]|nr:hypothetical protein HDE_05366 [Halotydeus destructor]